MIPAEITTNNRSGRTKYMVIWNRNVIPKQLVLFSTDGFCCAERYDFLPLYWAYTSGRTKVVTVWNLEPYRDYLEGFTVHHRNCEYSPDFRVTQILRILPVLSILRGCVFKTTASSGSTSTGSSAHQAARICNSFGRDYVLRVYLQ